MTENTDLRRDLGFWAALTIGAGTMIGAGIFLLSGIAVSLAGPAAMISYIIAGIVCIITAASAAELATGMPTSGTTIISHMQQTIMSCSSFTGQVSKYRYQGELHE